MTDILDDTSPSALAHAVKSNLYEFFFYSGRAHRLELWANSSLHRWRTALQHPWFNGVLSSKPAPDCDPKVAAVVVAYFRSQAVNNFTWWLAPNLTRDDWECALEPLNFHYDDSTPGMALDLRNLPADPQLPPNLEILPVTDFEHLKAWTQTFVAGYELPADWEPDLFTWMVELGFNLPMRNYLGLLNGKPVATSNLFLGAGVAGIQFVSTLAEARGQGLGAAMTLAPLYEARQLGYRLSTLQASDMGYRVYQRLGYQAVCQMGHFHWSGG